MANGLITKSSPINFGGTNRIMQMILPMLQQKYMIDLRNKNMQELLEKRMGGYRGLERQRHAGTMTEIGERHKYSVEYMKEKVITELAKDTRMEQLAGRIYLDELEGKDTTEDMDKLKQGGKAIALLAAKTANLETGTTDEFVDAAMVATEDFVQTMGTQMATTGRQEERLEREVKPAHDLAEGRLTLDKAREKRTREAGAEVGGLTVSDLNAQMRTLNEREKILDEQREEASDKNEVLLLDEKLKTILQQKIDIIERKESLLGMTTTRPVAGAVGGAPTDAFRRYYDILISRGATPEEAEAIARSRYPE